MLPVPPLDPLPRPRDRVETVRSTTAAALAAHAARAVTERGVEAWPQAAAAPVRPDSPNAPESRAQPLPASHTPIDDDAPVARPGARGALIAAAAAAAAYGSGARAPAPGRSASLDLSPVARALMTAVGGSPSPGSGALVHVSAPLLARAPTDLDVPALSTALSSAIEDSGLFYEAHLAQWIAGDRSTERLRREPAAQVAASDADESGEPRNARAAADTGAAAPPADARREMTPAVAERVAAQLALLDTGVLRFAGEAWPGQRIDVEIVDPRDAGRFRHPAASAWKLTLVLTTPSLGELRVALALDGGMLSLHVAASSDEARRDVHRSLPKLRRALSARELPIAALSLSDGTG